MTKLHIVLFLFLMFQSSLNESKDSRTADHFEYNNTIFSLIKKGHPSFNYFPSKDYKLKSAKRLADQKQQERNQLCSHLKHLKCTNLPPECLNCNFNLTCAYGLQIETTCRPFKNYSCEVSIVIYNS